MNKLADILKVIGGILLLYSAVITFKTNLPQEIENIIYFRGIVLGSTLIFVGSGISSKNYLCQNLLYSLASGSFLVFVASVYNLIYDSKINLDFYFDVAIFGNMCSFIVIISAKKIVKICLQLFKSSI